MSDRFLDTRFYTYLGERSLGDLVSTLDVECPEPAFQDEVISSVGDLATAGPGRLSFLTSQKNKAALETSKATACLVTEACADIVGSAGIIPIVSKSPRAHFGRIIHQLARKKTIFDGTLAAESIPSSAQIHPTAIIGEGAAIGKNVQIGAYSVILPGVEIGAGGRIGNNVSIECSEIGKNVVIQDGTRIGASGFGMAADENGMLDLPHIGRVIIGDNVSIGNNCTIDRGFLGDTTIGNAVKVDNMVHIAHNVSVGEGTMFAGHSAVAGSTKIGENVLVGGGVGIPDHITVGDKAILAARACPMNDVPAGEMWSGIPAMPIREHMRVIAATRKLVKKRKPSA